MDRLLQILLIFLLGAGLGWWLRGALPEAPVNAPAVPEHGSAVSREDTSPPARLPEAVAVAPEPESPAPAIQDQPVAPGVAFRRLLREGEFADAVSLYESQRLRSPDTGRLLYSTLLEFAERCLSECRPDHFLDLVENWLGAYYDDIDVLLLLAEHQRREGVPEMAANTLLTARTYALSTGEQEAVRRALDALVAQTDSLYSRQLRWIELLGFYEYLQAIDLSLPTYQLRQAELYTALGEPGRGQRLLMALQDSGYGLDPALREELDRRLAQEPPPLEELPGAAIGDAIALTRQRDHYLVPAVLNDDTELVLLIDTGASITTISSERFRTLPRSEFILLGSRMFNTANGYTRGDVYRTRSLVLGDHSLEDLAIAVLPNQFSEGTDGLLGMNVLRNFRFEIDQDRALLNLEPR